MKVLLFSDKNDIDGMGSVVLAKLAFKNLEYILCDTIKLQDEVQRLYEEKLIYDYDMIYITDMWLLDPILTQIADDQRLRGKIYIFDHHKSAIEENLDRYNFTKIRVSDDKGKCCGTSLFYEHLVDNNFLPKTKGLYQFVELTRKYDTWEWKTRYNEEKPNDLNILFNCAGPKNYIQTISERLEKENKDFDFSKEEQLIIENKKMQIQEKIKNYVNNIIYRNIFGYPAGVLFIEHEYRNDIAQYLRNSGHNIEFVMLIALDNNTISYRNIDSDVNVRLIAEKFGGKGHDYAAGSPITTKQKEQIVDILLKTDE